MRISDWSSDVCSSDLTGFPDAIIRTADIEGVLPHRREILVVTMELAIRLGQHVTVVDLAVVGGQHGTADATTVLTGEPHHHVARLVRRWKDDVEGLDRWRDSAGIALRKPANRCAFVEGLRPPTPGPFLSVGLVPH